MATSHRSSAGHTLSAPNWIDLHFDACIEEYEDMLKAARLPEAGAILDVGCGTGRFAKLIGDATGANALVLGLDISPEGMPPSCGQQQYLQGSMQRLPVQDGSLDAIWCANVLQYCSEPELRSQLAEFRRCLRPGGLLAVKDMDMSGWRVEPSPAFLSAHLGEAAARNDLTGNSPGSLRGRRLRTFLEAAEFEGVQQSTRVIERWAPLDHASELFWSSWLQFLAEVAAGQVLPAEDSAFWQSVASPQGAEHFVRRHDFYGCEMQVIAWGRAPV